MSCRAGSTCFRDCRKADKMELIIQKAVELGAYRDHSGRDETLCCKAGSARKLRKRENGGSRLQRVRQNSPSVC